MPCQALESGRLGVLSKQGQGAPRALGVSMPECSRRSLCLFPTVTSFCGLPPAAPPVTAQPPQTPHEFGKSLGLSTLIIQPAGRTSLPWPLLSHPHSPLDQLLAAHTELVTGVLGFFIQSCKNSHCYTPSSFVV